MPNSLRVPLHELLHAAHHFCHPVPHVLARAGWQASVNGKDVVAVPDEAQVVRRPDQLPDRLGVVVGNARIVETQHELLEQLYLAVNGCDRIVFYGIGNSA